MKTSYAFIPSAPLSRIQLENPTETIYRTVNTQQINLNTKLVRLHPSISPREGARDLYLMGQSQPFPQGCKQKVMEMETADCSGSLGKSSMPTWLSESFDMGQICKGEMIVFAFCKSYLCLFLS